MKAEKRRKRWPVYADCARMDAISKIDVSILDLLRIINGNPSTLETARIVARVINELRLAQKILNDVKSENYEG
jgi:hypothetical protein